MADQHPNDKQFHVYMVLRTQADITEARLVGDLNRVIQQWTGLPLGYITGGIVKEVEQHSDEELVCDNHPDYEPTRLALRFCDGCSTYLCDGCYQEHNE